LASVRTATKRAVNEREPTDDKGRTFIIVNNAKLDEAWRALQDALIAHNCPIYVRANKLVTPLWRWEKAYDGSNVLVARFEPVNLTMLMDMAAHHAV
jgi:hypothetical protein